MPGYGDRVLAQSNSIMEQIEFMDLIESYTKQFKDNISVKEVVYQLAKDNLIDKREMRNKAILKDFEMMLKENGQSMSEIQKTLSFKYNLSIRMIQEIVWRK